jgi:hypothetical protein
VNPDHIHPDHRASATPAWLGARFHRHQPQLFRDPVGAGPETSPGQLWPEHGDGHDDAGHLGSRVSGSAVLGYFGQCDSSHWRRGGEGGDGTPQAIGPPGRPRIPAGSHGHQRQRTQQWTLWWRPCGALRLCPRN